MEGKRSRSAAVILGVVLSLMLTYPLSVGPVCFLFQYFDWGPMTYTIQEGIVLFYSPLDLLPEPMNTWVAEWWNHGTDLGAEMQ